MENIDPKKITLTQFTLTFVPFALLLTAALMAAELPQILDNHRPIYTIESLVYYRTIFTIWLTIAFMIPALFLFFMPGESDQQNNYRLLCWTFGFVAFLIHFYYAVGVVFHGSLAEVYAKQGAVIATSNFLDLVWWSFDLILAWFVRSKAKWIKIQRIGAHIYIPLTFFVSAVVIKQGFVRALGIVMTIALVSSVVWRLVKRKQKRPATDAGVAAV